MMPPSGWRAERLLWRRTTRYVAFGLSVCACFMCRYCSRSGLRIPPDADRLIRTTPARRKGAR